MSEREHNQQPVNQQITNESAFFSQDKVTTNDKKELFASKNLSNFKRRNSQHVRKVWSEKKGEKKKILMYSKHVLDPNRCNL